MAASLGHDETRIREAGVVVVASVMRFMCGLGGWLLQRRSACGVGVAVVAGGGATLRQTGATAEGVIILKWGIISRCYGDAWAMSVA